MVEIGLDSGAAAGTGVVGWLVVSSAAAASLAVGFGFGPMIVGGLATFWTELLLPSFSLLYIYGVALCT